MKKISIHFFVILIIIVLNGTIATAQVVVSFTNPTNTTPNLAASYTSLNGAITALHGITAISEPVTLTAAAGVETPPSGGYIINFTTGTNLANNVVLTGTTINKMKRLF